MAEYHQYIPLPGFDNINRMLTFLSAADPAQGIMRGMDASGRAFDPDLTPEQRKAALIETGIETASPLLMMGLGTLAKQPVKATLMDVLTPTGATKEIAEDVLADPRNAPLPTGIETLVPTEDLVPRPMQLTEGERPFAPPRDYDDFREDLGGEGMIA